MPENDDSSRGAGIFLLGFVLGGALGLGAGLLLSTERGREQIDDIRQRFVELRSQAQKVASDAADRVPDHVDLHPGEPAPEA